MKNKGLQRVLAGLMLVLWMGTFYPGSLFHSHETEVHECHLNCVASEEEAGIHNECDHEVHIHDEVLPCFLCEFTLTKSYIAPKINFLDPEFKRNSYQEFTTKSAWISLVKNLPIRGPPTLS